MPLVRRTIIQDEGVQQGAVNTINAVGAGVSATVSGGVASLNISGGGGGGGTTVNVGTTTVNFGAFPGASDATVAVTGQAGITGTSLIKAWIHPVATSDHSADEHLAESILAFAHSIVAGTGFSITARNLSQLNEPLMPPIRSRHVANGTAGQNTGLGPTTGSVGGQGTRIYGQWTVAWLWI